MKLNAVTVAKNLITMAEKAESTAAMNVMPRQEQRGTANECTD